MAFSPAANAEILDRSGGLPARLGDNARSLNSAVSWGAVAAGAAAPAALSLILLILGVGLGLSFVSPWAREGVSATTFGVSTIVWVTLTQLLASAMGGYLAGRLRTKSTDVHTDEVYFRDTAHGFLAWAVASLATAALLTSAIGSILGSGVQAGASLVGGVAGTAGTAAAGSAAASAGATAAAYGGSMGYFVDSLFRRGASATATTDAAAPAANSIDALGRVKAEQNEMFVHAKTSSLDMAELGARMAARKDELMALAA